MKVYMHIVVAMAVATRTSAQCTVVFGWKMEGGASPACVETASGLSVSTDCNVKAMDGYTATGTGVNTCGAGSTLTAEANLAVTGCGENYYQMGGSTAANIECAACAFGKVFPATTVAAVTACTDCIYVTPGSCSSGCPDNYYQSAGTSSTVAAIVCTSCEVGKVLPAAAVQATVTACTACTYVTPGSCSSGCPANYYQSAGTSTTAAAIVCTSCEIGKVLPAAAVAAAVTACNDCIYATAGSCSSGCPANYYQSAGTSTTSAAIVCTACLAGKTSAAAAVASAVTTCTGSVSSNTSVSNTTPSTSTSTKTSLGGATLLLGVVMFLAVYRF